MSDLINFSYAMKKRFTLFILLLAPGFSAWSQTLATFKVEMPADVKGFGVPAGVNLDPITFAPDSVIRLFLLENGKRTPMASQITPGDHRWLYWIIPSSVANSKKSLTFELARGAMDEGQEVTLLDKDGAYVFHEGTKDLLAYHYGIMMPPEGVDASFKRSGFIHPLWSPHGQILTRVQPPDHRHHYGIWNPWTHVLFEGDTVDFWNLGDKQGTVRFAGFSTVQQGPVYAEFQANHEHVVFKKDGSEKIALNELQTIRVYRPMSNADAYIVDFTSELSCASASPVRILAYRYQGLGWRTTEAWTKDNSEVLTSEGKTRKDADGSTARWCIVQGDIDQDYAGAIMMSYPANYNHPEPLRIWPENMFDRGDMFANFCPTKNMDWPLEPGKTYTLRYRLLVFNGHMDAGKAESAWQYFANPPRISSTTN